MGRKPSQTNRRLIFNVLFYLLLTVIWLLITLRINNYESQNGYFEIGALLQFKLFLPAVVFGGRCLLFTKYRLGRSNLWFFPVGLFLVGWSIFDKLANSFNSIYCLLIAADSIIWAFLIKESLETVRTVIYFWRDLPKINYAILGEIWVKIESDLIKLGIWLTFLIGLSFFYLVNFFIVDAILYSYLLLMPLLGCGVLIYSLFFSKIKRWVRSDLAVIDSELVEQLNWKQVKDDPELPKRTVWIQYLTLVRNFLKDLQRPVFLKLIVFYLGYSGLILILPYLCGRVIEV